MMPTNAHRAPALVLAVLTWLALLPYAPALAADNYTDGTTTLDGDWVNHATISTTANNTPAMHSDGSASQSSINAADGVLQTSGSSSPGIWSENGGTASNAGSVTTTGSGGTGVASTGGGTAANSGTVTATGASSYGLVSIGGGTATNSGTISVTGASGLGIMSRDTGSVINSGSITTDGNTAYSIFSTEGGSVTNSGSVTANGNSSYGIYSTDGGTLINSGSVSATGTNSYAVYIANYGTLTNSGSLSATNTGSHAIYAQGADIYLQTGTEILGDVYGVAVWTNHLYLDGSGDVDFDIAGTWASLTKTGTGTWTISQSPSATVSALNLNSGTLAVASGVSLAVNSYTQLSGTTLAVNLDGTTVPVVASGSASLAGTLDVLSGASAATVDTPLTILTAAGGVSGTFSSLNIAGNPNFSSSLTYNANSVQLTSTFTPQWDAPSLSLGSVLAGVQGLSGISTTRSLLLLSEAKENTPKSFMVAAVGPLEGLFTGRDKPDWGAYLQPMYVSSSRSPSGGLGYDADMSGVEAGLDRFVTDDALVGVMAGYASTRLNFKGSAFAANDSEDQDMLTLGAYAGWAPGDWRLTDVVSASRVEHDSSRYAGLGETAEAHYASWVLANRLLAAYVWVPVESWEISPRLGLDVIHISRGGFSESGATNAVTYHDFDKTFFEGSAGLRATRRFQIRDAQVSPYAGLGYVRDLGNNDISVRQYLTSTSSALVTTKNDDERLTSELGLILARAPLSLTVAYNGEYGDTTDSHALSAMLRWEF